MTSYLPSSLISILTSKGNSRLYAWFSCNRLVRRRLACLSFKFFFRCANIYRKTTFCSAWKMSWPATTHRLRSTCTAYASFPLSPRVPQHCHHNPRGSCPSDSTSWSWFSCPFKMKQGSLASCPAAENRKWMAWTVKGLTKFRVQGTAGVTTRRLHRSVLWVFNFILCTAFVIS